MECLKLHVENPPCTPSSSPLPPRLLHIHTRNNNTELLSMSLPFLPPSLPTLASPPYESASDCPKLPGIPRRRRTLLLQVCMPRRMML
ncbi:hypothetical protein L228DRAFT_127735 [Xylona heveae TC161]|uniref:Uncharacterized protein n=1 Tax=Xylona heveae (strain CBS 132557 / TC161) TaxID=1328760 RepID=A0A165GRN1_XYLHT|nr:hypothetical protein L228DRAFT_127735 [Xylona heveae TC161]KZF22509.1 hypothetical protein L228DRAFT_127735 [Xylona heveae TC161]